MKIIYTQPWLKELFGSNSNMTPVLLTPGEHADFNRTDGKVHVIAADWIRSRRGRMVILYLIMKI